MLWIDRHLNMGEEDLCPTMVAKWGTGGGNVPYLLLMETDDGTLGISHGGDRKVRKTDDEESLTLFEEFIGGQYATDIAYGK